MVNSSEAWWVTDVKDWLIRFASDNFEVGFLTVASRQILVPGKTLRQVTFSAFAFLTSFSLGVVTSCALLLMGFDQVSYFSTLLVAFGSSICASSLTSAEADSPTGNFPEVRNEQVIFKRNQNYRKQA